MAYDRNKLADAINDNPTGNHDILGPNEPSAAVWLDALELGVAESCVNRVINSGAFHGQRIGRWVCCNHEPDNCLEREEGERTQGAHFARPNDRLAKRTRVRFLGRPVAQGKERRWGANFRRAIGVADRH